MPNSFSRTPGRHCYCALSVKFRVSEFYSVVFRQGLVIDQLCALAPCARPLLPGQSTARPLGRAQVSVAASIAGVGSFCGGCATCGGQRGPEPARHATRRRPTPPGSPRVPAMPAHARGTVAVARQARNVLPAADGPRHPRSVELAHSTKSQPD